MATDMNSPPVICTRCKYPQSNLDILARCAACCTPYCTPSCLRYDKTKHAKRCGRRIAPHNIMVLDGPVQVDEPFTRLARGTWLHGCRSRKDVFRLLIDCYRLRVDDQDTLSIEGEHEPIPILEGNDDDEGGMRKGFEEFLEVVAQREMILPDWWDEAARVECMAFGGLEVKGGEKVGGGEGEGKEKEKGEERAKEKGGEKGTEKGTEKEKEKDEKGGWYLLTNRVTKAMINNHYGSHLMAMQLRLLGQAIYQTGPGGWDMSDVCNAMIGKEFMEHAAMVSWLREQERMCERERGGARQG